MNLLRCACFVFGAAVVGFAADNNPAPSAPGAAPQEKREAAANERTASSQATAASESRGTSPDAAPTKSKSAAATAGEEQSPDSPLVFKDYKAFLAHLVRRESITELVATMDRLIEQGEREAGIVSGDTRIGLHLEFRKVAMQGVILYHVTLSRNGEEMRFSDAVKLIALFADRAGLTHPVDVREGEQPVFYGQWLIREEDWKDMRKKMLEVRAENRAEKDVFRALSIAVTRELDARQSFKASGG